MKRLMMILVIIYSIAGYVNSKAPSEKEIQAKYERMINYANEQIYQTEDEINLSLASKDAEESSYNCDVQQITEIQEKQEIKENEAVKLEGNQKSGQVVENVSFQEEEIVNEVIPEMQNEEKIDIDNYQFQSIEEFEKAEKIETYVENKEMEQKIVDYINNHPSENMEKFGYSVTIDNSITSLTTGFTYTDVRVESLLKFKAGAIKVYAQDFLVDGNLQWTQCFIF